MKCNVVNSLLIHCFYLFRSKSSQRLKAIPIYAKVKLEDCKTSVLKVKTEPSIGERAYQGITQPKKKHKARKSAGMIEKQRPIQQSSGKLGNVS